MQKKFYFLGIIVALALIQACSVKKFIPEDKLLYTGADLELTSEDEIEDRKALKAELESLITPEPNSRILGSRVGLYFHYKAQKENPGFINRFLNKRLGEEPVYLSDADPFQTEDLLKNRLENRGYFYSRVGHSVNENEKNKTATISYKAFLPENPYVLADYAMDSDTLLVYNAIKQNLDETLLKENEPFNLSMMKAERERIDATLKNRGYYNFSSNFLIFEADTNQYNQKRFDLYLRLKDQVPKEAIIPYKISRVNVYPNYNVEVDSTRLDTTFLEEKYFIQSDSFFEPKNLDPYILIDGRTGCDV